MSPFGVSTMPDPTPLSRPASVEMVTTDCSALAAIAGSSPAVRLSVVRAASADGDGAVAVEAGVGAGASQISPSVSAEATSADRTAATIIVRTGDAPDVGPAVGVGMSSIVVLHQVRADRSIGCSL